MNTIGKILVVLVMVVALVQGGFLVIDFATRTNWKNAYDALKAEIQVVGASTETVGETLAKLNREVGVLAADKLKLQQDIVDMKALHKIEVDSAHLLRDEAIIKTDDAVLNAKKHQAENLRIKEEIKGLVDTIAKREAYIAGIQDENKKLRTEAINLETQFRSATDRSQSLVAQVQELNKEIQKIKAGAAGTTKGPDGENPPAAYVKGKVETVHPTDKNLVTISVGSDQGVMKNHTLVVYRMSPQPEYLGTIRIVDSDHHQAVGRLMPSAIGRRAQLREGDTVASSLDRP